MTTGEDTPDYDETEAMGGKMLSSMGDERQFTIPLETLAVLNWLGDSGIDGIEGRLNRVLEDDLTVTAEQVKVGYAERETVSTQFSTAEYAGARVRLSQPFKGNALVLFSIESANKAATLMLQRAVSDLSSVSTELGRDALTELCNMTVNAFVDEWATLFETPIDTGSPIAIQGTEQTLVRRILDEYSMGMYITSHLRIPDYGITGTIFLFPGEEQFITKISGVGLEVIEE